MTGYKKLAKSKRQRRKWLPLVVAAVVVIILGVGVIRVVYTDNLKPVSSSQATKYFNVPSGASVDQIATSLKQDGLIRSVSAFENYLRTNELNDSLQAGTYILSPSMSAQQIATKMVHGDVAKNLITILPGKRLDQIKQTFLDSGYAPADVDTAFDPATYAGDSALNSLPRGATLEGYLYPDSFQKTTDTPAQTIVKESIDEMGSHLTTDIIKGFSAHGLSTYQGITLASIVYQETDSSDYQSTVAQVFLSRLAQGMALESNVTDNYAADQAGVPRTINIDSPYNLYLHTGLTPGPIGNVTAGALNAVAHPTTTDYLYFVADKDKKVHFSRTLDEHNQAVKDYLN